MINADIAKLLSEISNDDIEWDGTPVGIMPTKVKGASLDLVNAGVGEVIVPALLEALAIEDKFAAAHVLLTNLTNIQLPKVRELEGFSSWNGLAVNLKAGKVIFGNTPLELQQIWQEALDLKK